MGKQGLSSGLASLSLAQTLPPPPPPLWTEAHYLRPTEAAVEVAVAEEAGGRPDLNSDPVSFLLTWPLFSPHTPRPMGFRAPQNGSSSQARKREFGSELRPSITLPHTDTQKKKWDLTDPNASSGITGLDLRTAKCPEWISGFGPVGSGPTLIRGVWSESTKRSPLGVFSKNLTA